MMKGIFNYIVNLKLELWRVVENFEIGKNPVRKKMCIRSYDFGLSCLQMETCCYMIPENLVPKTFSLTVLLSVSLCENRY